MLLLGVDLGQLLEEGDSIGHIPRHGGVLAAAALPGQGCTALYNHSTLRLKTLEYISRFGRRLARI